VSDNGRSKTLNNVKLTQITAKKIYARLRREWHKHVFSNAIEKITQVRPLLRGQLPLIVLSMVQSRDTLPYLLALLSFTRYVNPERVVVVCDPSMSTKDLQILKTAVPHIELRRAEEFRHPELPIGGCWERLQAITQYAASAYVIQLDADTVTLSTIDEVYDAVAKGHSFVLGERARQQITSLEEARLFATPWQGPSLKIQGVAEFLMPEAKLSGQRYVRGCAGFTGFQRTPELIAPLLEFSNEMRRLTGTRWTEWGTEQVASNYLVANLESTAVLPFPDYGTPDMLDASPRFLHFIGSMRFESPAYTQTANRVIAELRSAP
jgi:hypothetical protein